VRPGDVRAQAAITVANIQPVVDRATLSAPGPSGTARKLNGPTLAQHPHRTPTTFRWLNAVR
jgi:hypothetical protein